MGETVARSKLHRAYTERRRDPVTIEIDVPDYLFEEEREEELNRVIEHLRREQVGAVRCDNAQREALIGEMMEQLRRKDHRRTR